MRLEAPENALAESENTLLSSRGASEHLEGLRSTAEVDRSVREVCMLIPDRFTFCWCRSVLVQHERLSYASMNWVTFTAPQTGVPIVPVSGICFFFSTMARASIWMNCLWSCTWLDKVLVDGSVLAEDLAWHEGPWLEEPVWPQKPAVEVHPVCSVDTLISTVVAVWRWNGGLGGELAVISDLRSIVGLWVVGRGVGQIDSLFEMCSFFYSFPSPALPPFIVFPLSCLPHHLSLGFYSLWLLPPPLVVFSLGFIIIWPA